MDVKKVAELARLELSESEKAYYNDKFQGIMSLVDSLAAVEIAGDLQGKDESLQVIYREDEMKKSDVSPEDFSQNIENHHFKVPSVID